MHHYNGLDNLTWFMGIVEKNDDPTNQGRIKVRAFGFHPPLNTNEVLTEDLPWAFLINGTGGSFFSIPEVNDWVFGFFMDGRDAQHPFVIGVVHGAHLGLPYDGAVGYGEGQVDPPLAEAAARQNIPPLSGNKNLEEARSVAENYLGRPMSNDEWDSLVRATFAEASSNPRERAAVMGVILNRVKTGYGGGSTVTDILNQRNQFQAVTGTNVNPGPSTHYTADRSQTELGDMADAVNTYLPTVNNTWLNFTANSSAAYGPGTDIGFRERVINSGGEIIGQTVFGTVR